MAHGRSAARTSENSCPELRATYDANRRGAEAPRDVLFLSERVERGRGADVDPAVGEGGRRVDVFLEIVDGERGDELRVAAELPAACFDFLLNQRRQLIICN